MEKGKKKISTSNHNFFRSTSTPRARHNGISPRPVQRARPIADEDFTLRARDRKRPSSSGSVRQFVESHGKPRGRRGPIRRGSASRLSFFPPLCLSPLPSNFIATQLPWSATSRKTFPMRKRDDRGAALRVPPLVRAVTPRRRRSAEKKKKRASKREAFIEDVRRALLKASRKGRKGRTRRERRAVEKSKAMTDRMSFSIFSCHLKFLLKFHHQYSLLYILLIDR